MAHDIGDTIRLFAEDLRDAAGTLVNATTVVLTVTAPDGTTSTPPVTNPPAQTGKYFGDFTAAQAGTHKRRFVFTTPNETQSDVFEVRDAAPLLMMSLKDAKDHLNVTSTTDDEEIRGHVEAVTRVVEWRIGAVPIRNVTDVLDAGPTTTMITPARIGLRELVLNRRPVTALVSVAPVFTGGPSYAVADLDLDGDAGIVRRKDGGLIQGLLRVTYTIGRRSVPANAVLAGKIILQHLWATQRGALSTNVDQEETVYLSQFGFAVPRRALELLEPDPVGSAF